MAWSFGHSLTVILALLLGVAGGWILRGRRDAQESGRPTVDGGTAVLATPAPAAVTDPGPAAATIDPAPSEAADQAITDPLTQPNDTAVPNDAALAATTDAVPASDVDPADMALTDGPVPVVAPRSAPEAERLEAAGADDSPEPAEVTAESEPATGSALGDESVRATTPRTETGFSASFAAEPFGVLVSATGSEEDTRAHVEPGPEASTDVRPAADTRAEAGPDVKATDAATTAPNPAAGPPAEPVAAMPGEAMPGEATSVAPNLAAGPPAAPIEAAPIEAAPADGPMMDAPVAGATPSTQEAKDDERAEAPSAATRRSAVATPPVRPVAATSVEVDDFRRIQGIGPKMAAALQAAGVRTYQQLAELDETTLRDLIRAAGLRAAPGLATWPQQARVLASAPDEAATALPVQNGTSEA